MHQIQTQNGIPSKSVDVCSNYIRNSISKWAVPSLLIITPTIYLLCQLEVAEDAERMVSDSFSEILLQFNITCLWASRKGWVVCTHKLCDQNLFCTALFSYTSTQQLYAKKNSKYFWQELQETFTWCPVGGLLTNLFAPYQPHISTLLHDVALSTQI